MTSAAAPLLAVERLSVEFPTRHGTLVAVHDISIATHLALPPAAARARAVELLDEVGIAGAARRLDHCPHQFSGGMRQLVGARHRHSFRSTAADRLRAMPRSPG